MRSELVFRAQDQIGNRYQLCHAAAKTTRCLHYCSTTTHDAIIDAFTRIAHVPCLFDPEKHAQPEPKAYET